MSVNISPWRRRSSSSHWFIFFTALFYRRQSTAVFFPVIRILPSETGSYLTAHTTIQSSRTAETVVDRKEAVSAEIFRLFSTFPVSADKNGLSGGFWASGLCIQKFRSRRQGFREPALGNRLLRCELRAASKPILDSIRARPATPSNAR